VKERAEAMVRQGLPNLNSPDSKLKEKK
jgi:hypothetical protein